MLNELAKKTIEKHTEIEPAYKALLRAVMKDPDLQRECIEPAVLTAIHAARGQATRYTKRHNPNAVTNAGLSAAASVATASFLATWFIGSKSLGELTATELRAEAVQEREQSRARAKCAEFYERIADRLKGDKVVRDVLDDDAARALWNKTNRDRGLRATVTHGRVATV